MTAPAIPLAPEEPRDRRRALVRLGRHRRPQAHRHPLPLDGALLLPRRRRARRSLVRLQLAVPRAHAAVARGVQPDLHDARHDDDLPRRDARAHRLRQLLRAAHDRRARHGVPAPQRDRLLALPAGRIPPAFQLARGRRAERRAGSATRRSARRRSRASPTAPTTGRSRCSCSGISIGRERDQPHRHDPHAARAGDDDAARAALRLDDVRQLDS